MAKSDYKVSADTENGRIGLNYMRLIDKAKYNAERDPVNIQKKLKYGSDYQRLRQGINGTEYEGCNFRDSSVRTNVLTFTALLTANDPKYSFMPVEPYDVALADIYEKYDRWQWNQMRMNLKRSLAILDMNTYGTGYLFIYYDKDKKQLDVCNPSLAEIYFDDYTKFDLDDHRRIYRLIVMPIQKAEKEYPHLLGMLDPTDDRKYTDNMRKLIRNWEQTSGTENPVSRVFSKSDMKREWIQGNVIGWEIWEKESATAKATRTTILNGFMAETKTKTKWSRIPLVAFRKDANQHSVLGTAEWEVSAPLSDAMTEAVHSMLYQKALFSKGVWVYSKLLNKTPAQIRQLANHPGHALEVDDRIFDRGAIKKLGGDPLNSADVQILPILRELIDNGSGNSRWLQGSVAPGEDPASKVAYLQQAGMNRIKMQAKTIDQDAHYRLAHILLEYYQTLKSHEIIRVVGETYPDGSQKFIDINMEITKESLEVLIGLAARSGEPEMIPGYDTAMTAEELEAQRMVIEQRAAQEGIVPLYKLNDMSIAKFDISIEDSDVLPFNEAQRRQTVGMLRESGDVSSREMRELYGYPIDEKSMSQLRSTIDIIPPEQIAMQLQQAMQQGEEAAMMALQQTIEYIAQLQQRLT